MLLKSYLVQNFVKTYNRSPTEAELLELITQAEKKFINIEETGLSDQLVEIVHHKEESSRTKENTNREAFYNDLIHLHTKLESVLQKEELCFWAAKQTLQRLHHTIDVMNLRLDNLLFLQGQDTIFAHRIEENFRTGNFIDQINSTVSIQPGNITLKRRATKRIDLTSTRIKTSIITKEAVIASTSILPVNNLKTLQPWEFTIQSNKQSAQYGLIIELEFEALQDVSLLQIDALPYHTTLYTIYYSNNGSDFQSLAPEQQILNLQNLIVIDRLQIKKLQIVLMKSQYDVQKEHFEYQFQLSKLQLFTSEYKDYIQNTLFCGPYSVLDVNNNAVYFTKASLESCSVLPENTNIAFYLSQDNTTWQAVNTTTNYVTFGSAIPEAKSLLDETRDETQVYLTPEADGFELSQDEILLNVYLNEIYSPLISRQSLVIKRNLSSGTILRNKPIGWNYENDQYSTTIYLQAPRVIDFGPKGILLNQKYVSGAMLVPAGYSTIITDKSNWLEIDQASSERELKRIDSLYPYNHKYLIEGYSYSNTFTGIQIYQPVDEYFEVLMRYISPEEFSILKTNQYRYYTIVEKENAKYFLCRTQKHSSTWKDELFSVDYKVASAPTNELYVKAVFTSTSKTNSPSLQSFQVRMI